MKQWYLRLICLVFCWPFPQLFISQKTILFSLQAQVDTLLAHQQLAEAGGLLEKMLSYDRSVRDSMAFQHHARQLTEVYYDQKIYTRGEEISREAIIWLTGNHSVVPLSCAEQALFRALHLLKLERYSDALNSYLQAIRVYESYHFNGSKLAFCYKNAAQIRMRWSDYTGANNLLEAAVRSDTTQKYLLSIYGQLANNFYWQNNLPQALYYFQQGQRVAPDNSIYTASLRAVGADVLSKLGRWEEARRLGLAAANYYHQQNQIEEHIRVLTTLSDVAVNLGQLTQAQQYLKKAEQEGRVFFHHKSREMAKLYVETGLLYEKTKQPDRALACYQQALIQAFPNFNSAASHHNPPLADAYLEVQAMRAAAVKAQLLLKATQPNSADRLNAAHCFDLAFAVADRLRRTYGDDADKYTLATVNRTTLSTAVGNLWQLYRDTHDPILLTRLFDLLERTRATALADALQQQRALVLAGIPDSLLMHEQNLRLEAASTAKELRDKEMKGKVEEINTLKALLFHQQKAYNDLLNDLQNRYPQFAQYNHADQVADLPTIQAALPDSTALLSWFDAGDRDRYLCLVVRRTGLTAYEVPRDSTFDRRLSGFLLRLADKAAQESAPGEYFTEAFALGQQLLPAEATAGLQRLVIIPDGRLCYLPFEALLTAPHTGNFAQAPYLLRSHTVQYAWSATLLTLAADRQNDDNQGFLQVAPFAETTRDGLALLPNSLRDKPADLAATVLAGEQASVAGFLGNAAQYDVLHLSTHANAGGSGQPGIELYDRTLTLPEVYSQRFHASLIALSACETGAGQLATGEGVLSLARAFAYAGAQSLVASHWPVNERSTADLFSAFYKNLAKGLSKAEALRQAKLAYLSSNEMDARKAPYQWAAFTLTGADGPVKFGKPWWSHWSLWLGGLGLAGMGLWFFRSRKKS